MISEELVQGLIRDLARNSDRLLNDRDSDFVLQSVRLEPATDGSWELEGTVDVDATAAEMGICMVRCGGVDHELEFEYLPLGMRGARRYQRLQFRQRFEPEEAATVQLELSASPMASPSAKRKPRTTGRTVVPHETSTRDQLLPSSAHAPGCGPGLALRVARLGAAPRRARAEARGKPSLTSARSTHSTQDPESLDVGRDDHGVAGIPS